MADIYLERRLRHRARKYSDMITVLRMLEAREELHYGEAAAALGSSPSYAYSLMAMMSHMYTIPFRDGIMDNPGKQLLRRIAEDLRNRIQRIRKRIEKAGKKKKKERRR